MNSPLPASAPAPRRNWSRRLVNALVALVVIAVAAAAFVFSYDGVHAVALLGGISPRLARYYPGLFDAVLVIACVAAVALRDGRWWARVWSWLVIVIVLAGIGTTDVLHAMNYTLRHRLTEGIVAAAPVVAVLLAFSLLLTVLRQSRNREPGQPPAPVTAPLELTALPAAATMPSPIALPAGPVPASAATREVLTREIPAREAPTREVPSLGDGTREVPSLGDGPVLYDPLPVGPADGPGPHEATQEVPTVVSTADTAHPAPAPAPQPEPEPEPGPKTPPDGLPVMTRSATEPAAVIAPAEPGAVIAPAEPAADQPEEPAAPARPTARPAIRYAGSGTLARPGKRVTAEPEPASGAATDSRPAPDTSATPDSSATPESNATPESSATADSSATPDSGASSDYWDADDGVQYAGLVYAAREERADSGAAGEDETPGPAEQRRAPEPDDDAPPFATAPFAPVPRLNRVRSMPEPPADDEDE